MYRHLENHDIQGECECMNNQAYFWIPASGWASFTSWNVKGDQLEGNMPENLTWVFL